MRETEAFAAPSWRRAAAASLLAPVVAGPAFFPPVLVFPPFGLFAIVIGYAVTIVPTLGAGMVQDRVVRRHPNWRRAGRWYLVGAGIGFALYGIYLPMPVADVGSLRFPRDLTAVVLIGLGCGSAGGAVAALRYRLAHRSRLGRPQV